MSTTETTHPNLAAALVAAQEEMPGVAKTGRGNYGQHVTLDELISKTKPVLTKHGLTILQFPEQQAVIASETKVDLVPTLRTVILHSSGEKMEWSMPLYLAGHDMQKLGAAITYARRYAWAAALGITVDEDDDGERAVSKPTQPANTRSRVSPLGAVGFSNEETNAIAEKFGELVDKLDLRRPTGSDTLAAVASYFNGKGSGVKASELTNVATMSALLKFYEESIAPADEAVPELATSA